ncbi:HAMP domain-containing sensor histidine kinase [Paenibacillus dendritiformis]|uniref:sensor histidine kinase n=1 Tax=Paenibacillus dendritiformis TaxID=130049 RepID=UPI00248ACE8E|nr:HAMP domain-containing sensor histidine kinase [Paenibacillus dendritiformis]WGU95809.1 HAMP domain-containing sensor histidine kinase [Paenibacillus dendritiformis]
MRKRGIAFKIFGITSALLIVSALILYLTLFFLLPNYYYKYKETNVSSKVQSLIESLDAANAEEAANLLIQFEFANNVRVVLRDPAGEVAYPASPGSMDPAYIDELMRGPKPPGADPFRPDAPFRPGEHGGKDGGNFISLEETVQFADQAGDYKLFVYSPVQPIDEASQVILMFLPYMSIVILGIAMIGAAIYSKLLSKPLIHLNQVASQMAQLDFTVPSTIRSKDELGELSSNLNILAGNLQSSMSELKQANEKLRDDIQKEREQEQKRREFVATISHELKTPITAVSGQLEGMLHQIGSYKDRDKYLQQSYEIMKEMEKLVHEILNISELESFDFKPRIGKVHLSALIQRSLDQFLYFRDIKQLEFDIDIEPDLYIQADEKLISRAVANLLSNAVKYSGDGETVCVSLRRHGANGSLLSILNTGAQIEPSQLERIFEPFYRVEKSRNRKTGGSGLGLYIVQKILDMHGLRYQIRNVPEGVRFDIQFM